MRRARGVDHQVIRIAVRGFHRSELSESCLKERAGATRIDGLGARHCLELGDLRGVVNGG